eukprot:TRINITY_DN12691_c0_g1_i2.p1 TRINITY_DN12691_c0_g1~~TRINITY_DN12691_c0_g1_i2.p1  ORF type:complete len:645 (-),score=136.72 TRINITY_DN12691_c0_g1_i2:21-1955(-)
MSEELHAVFIGDAGTGKSTLLASFANSRFVDKVDRVIQPLVVPPSVLGIDFVLFMHDTSSAAADLPALVQLLSVADVVCILHSPDKEHSLRRVGEYYLPLVRQHCPLVPVIVVAAKQDTKPEVQLPAELEPAQPFLLECEARVECSAKSTESVKGVILQTLAAAVAPSAPLFDPIQHSIRPTAGLALRRIFELCDQDKDGFLSDAEMSAFQSTCFGAPLSESEIADLRSTVSKSVENGVADEGITLKGFLFLQALFIRRGKRETTWTILRTFGYNRKLLLIPEYVRRNVPLIAGQTAEPSAHAIEFLTSLYRTIDQSHSGSVSPAEIVNQFALVPRLVVLPEDFPSCIPLTKSGGVSLQGWLLLWSLICSNDHYKYLCALCALGFGEEISEAVALTRSRRVDVRKGKTARTVLRCAVFGAPGVGKSGLIYGLVHHTSRGSKTGDSAKSVQHTTINTIPAFGQDSEKQLILQEVTPAETEKLIRSRPSFDAAVLVYSLADPDSFSVCASTLSLLARFTPEIPVVLVAAKSDLEAVPQNHPQTPQEVCDAYGIAHPCEFSVKGGDIELYSLIVAVAAKPLVALPKRPATVFARVGGALFRLAVAGGLAAALGYVYTTHYAPAAATAAAPATSPAPAAPAAPEGSRR